MKPKTFKIRYQVSLGFYVLGFIVPVIVGLYVLRDSPVFIFIGSIFVIFPVWLPATVLSWLVAAYIAPVPTYRRIGWVIFILGLLMSAVWGYVIVGALSH